MRTAPPGPVNTVFVRDGLSERLRAEGERSPADVLMTVDTGNLLDVVNAGYTQAVDSDVLEDAIPAHLRGEDGHWFTLSLRDRVLYADKDLELDGFAYEDLADPQWKGRVCIRSGQHPYNTSLFAAMIAHAGVEATEQWLRGVKDNLARKAAGGDRDVARDILAGICDIGIANAYYVGRMKNAEPGSEQHQWGEAIKVIRPVFASAEEAAPTSHQRRRGRVACAQPRQRGAAAGIPGLRRGAEPVRAPTTNIR